MTKVVYRSGMWCKLHRCCTGAHHTWCTKEIVGAVWCCTGAMSFIYFAVRCCTGEMSFCLLGGAVYTGATVVGAVLYWCTIILSTGGVVHTGAARMHMVRWCIHRCKEKKSPNL